MGVHFFIIPKVAFPRQTHAWELAWVGHPQIIGSPRDKGKIILAFFPKGIFWAELINFFIGHKKRMEKRGEVTILGSPITITPYIKRKGQSRSSLKYGYHKAQFYFFLAEKIMPLILNSRFYTVILLTNQEESFLWGGRFVVILNKQGAKVCALPPPRVKKGINIFKVNENTTNLKKKKKFFIKKSFVFFRKADFLTNFIFSSTMCDLVKFRQTK